MTAAMRRFAAWAAFAGAAALVLPVAGLRVLDALADREAARIFQAHRGDTQQETVLGLARWGATAFGHDGTWHAGFSYLLENERLPFPFRLKRGTTDIFELDGNCDNLARVLERVFAAGGMEAVAHPLNAGPYGHVGVSIRLADGWAFIDPYSGVAFRDGDDLLSLPEVQRRAAAGRAVDDVLRVLRPDPDLRYYRDPANLVHARRGERMVFPVRPAVGEGGVVFGRPDGTSADVSQALADAGLTPHLSYVGPRYDRGFAFELSPPTSEGVLRATFSMTEAVDPDHLPVTNARMTVAGRDLVLKAPGPGEPITLDYADMGWSLARLLRMQSWYDVDRIRFEVTPAPAGGGG